MILSFIMKERLVAILVIVALAGGVGALIYQKRQTPKATRAKMVEQFIAILPDSLDNEHILEIRGLFYTLYEREQMGKVKPESSKFIMDKLEDFVHKGKILPHQLNYFMSEVGYYTYKDDKQYTLPDGSNDNPILNPMSNVVSNPYDSTFWADFKKWKKENPALVDSLSKVDPVEFQRMIARQDSIARTR